MTAPNERHHDRSNGGTHWAGAAAGPSELNADIERHREEIDRTLSALEDRLSPSDLMETLFRNMKSGPGEWVGNLGNTARDNPVPLTLIGVGLAWLMLGQGDGTGRLRHKVGEKVGQMRSGRDDDEPARPDYGSGLDDLDDDLYGSGDDIALSDLYAFCLTREYPFDEDEVECILYEDLGPEAAASYRGYGRAEPATGAESGGGMAEAAKAKASATAHEAKSRIDRTRVRMAAGSDEIRSRVGSARKAAKHRARQARDAAVRGARSVAGRTGDFVDRYPLSVLALGVATGAALGAGMPSTHVEDRFMGETSDSLKEQAGATAREQAGRAKRAAGAAAEAARDEARAQGLDKDHLARSGHELKERARAVVESGREEAERQGFTGEHGRESAREARERIERVAVAAEEAAERESRRH